MFFVVLEARSTGKQAESEVVRFWNSYLRKHERMLPEDCYVVLRG
jgi:hypothetical protein